jgi:pimeloyl-ACP methyl ester carboxylesterase
MQEQQLGADAYVFVSYSSHDRERALQVVRELQAADLRVWLDQQAIAGGRSWGREIVHGIRDCAVHVVLCSNAAMQSRNVLQEVQLAWKYERPYLPLLLERTTVPENVEYWLEGWQWVELLDRPAAAWLPDVLRALAGLGISTTAGAQKHAAGASPAPTTPPGEPAVLPQASMPAAVATADPAPWAPPETQYARSGDLYIAYSVAGSGPIDVVLTPGASSHLEYTWENRFYTKNLRRLASLCRLITYDKRGTGMSDGVSEGHPPNVEERMDDVRAVMDAAGSQRAVLFGISEGGPMNILFASTYPERVAALILYGTFATSPQKELSAAEREQILQRVAQRRGTVAEARTFLQRLAPSVADDPGQQQWFAKMTRLSSTPRAAMALMRMNWEIDVAHVLPAIRVPTLVLHLTGDRAVPVEQGRHLAATIPGARLVELPGEDHIPWFSDQADAIVEEVRRFIVDLEPADEVEQVLATVMAVAGVIALERQAGFHTMVQREVERYRGRLAAPAGDCMMATFDGPVRAIRCAGAIVVGARVLGIEARAGLHTGTCEMVADHASGPAVHTARQLVQQATSGEVLITSSVQDLIAGSGITVAERGTGTSEGVPGEWRLFAVQ